MCVGFLYIVSFVDALSSMCMQRSRNGSFLVFLWLGGELNMLKNRIDRYLIRVGYT